GRSWARNRGRRRTAGLDAATSGSSEFTVVGRPAKVVVDRLSVPGSNWSACSSDWPWRATAPVAGQLGGDTSTSAVTSAVAAAMRPPRLTRGEPSWEVAWRAQPDRRPGVRVMPCGLIGSPPSIPQSSLTTRRRQPPRLTGRVQKQPLTAVASGSLARRLTRRRDARAGRHARLSTLAGERRLGIVVQGRISLDDYVLLL